MEDWIEALDLQKAKSRYILPQYQVCFNDKIADRYKPIIFSNQCLSGSPKAVYYRIVANNSKELCIQYFFYWLYQRCLPSHRYDYEPIFIYLNSDESFPTMIVNGGFAGMDCGFHKNEIRPREGERDIAVRRFRVKMSKKPYYPFGKDGSVISEGCAKYYPLKGNDLQFEGTHPIFGIRACSNVFSGARSDLQGERFNPSLKKLTDLTLNAWYFKHYNKEEDMPFGHDIADPFSYPYIKYHSAREALPKKSHMPLLKHK